MLEHTEVRSKIAEAASANLHSFRLYRRFADAVWASTDIDARTTEIIAVAVTHATRCSTCVDFHTTKARALGVLTPELVEAGVLSAALQTLEVAETSTGAGEDDPFLRLPFNSDVVHLSVKVKALVVLAVAATLRNPSLAARARAAAVAVGANPAELAKAPRIAAALTAGAAVHFLADVAHVYASAPASSPVS